MLYWLPQHVCSYVGMIPGVFGIHQFSATYGPFLWHFLMRDFGPLLWFNIDLGVLHFDNHCNYWSKDWTKGC